MASSKIKHSQPSFDVLSGLALEINAPLKSLLKTSQKLIAEYKSRDFEYISYKDYKSIFATLEQMNRQLECCAQTTERLVRLKSFKAFHHDEMCQINDVVRGILSLLNQQLSLSKIKVFARLDKKLPLAKIGKVDCHQVIHNILMNALQAMPAGGKIKIKTTCDASKKAIVLNIEDEGVGITPEHLQKVFEPFFTTKERGIDKSSGLGLSIVYSIMHAIGGDIHIESSLRKGTLVCIEFPVKV